MPDVKKLSTSLIGFTYVLSLCCLPAIAAAEEVPPVPGLSPVIITEVQTGSPASASEEFIELYNTTDQPIDFETFNWRLEVVGSTATAWSPLLRGVGLIGTIGPKQTYIVASQYTTAGQTVHYLSDQARVWFSAALAAGSGHIRLTYATNQFQSDRSCYPSATVVDEVEWSTTLNGLPSNPSLDGRTVFATGTAGIPKTLTMQRLLRQATGEFADTGSDALDFSLDAASPNVITSFAAPDGTIANETPVPLPAHACSQNPPPEESEEDPPVVQPADPPVAPTDPAEPPQDGVDSQPTPPAAIQITEILPNPAAPQTDAEDEFVELYNPTDQPVDLSGHVLQAGLSATYRYLLPSGTIVGPKSFIVFTAATTRLSLSNSGGRVALVDPSGAIVAQTAEYGAAKDGQAWIWVGDTWEWTTTPTPGATNIIVKAAAVMPAVKAASTKAKVATSSTKKATAPKKTTAKPKASKTSQPKEKKITQNTANLVTDSPSSPVHPGILAVAALFALLYGAYEYRGDLANKVHKLRANRAARRENRRGAARRRGS